MTVKHIDIPYQFDITHMAPVVNELITKMKELAKDQFVQTPLDVYIAIDYVKITEIFNLLAKAQHDLCRELGIPTSLAAKEYLSIDYGNIIGCMVQLGDALNNMIDATQNMTQSEPTYEQN